MDGGGGGAIFARGGRIKVIGSAIALNLLFGLPLVWGVLLTASVAAGVAGISGATG